MELINAGIFGLLILLVVQYLNYYEVRQLLILPPSEAVGPLAKNSKLENAEILLDGKVTGAESQAFYNGALYSSQYLVDSRYIKIVNDEIVKEIPSGGGVPLGIRHYHDETFIAMDCLAGVVKVDFKTRSTKNLLSTGTIINGHKLTTPNDFDFISRDTIIFSDTSVSFSSHRYAIPLAAGINDGRLIKFNLTSGVYEQIADGFYFTNGVQTHADGESVLVAETGFGRVSRFYFAGPKKGVREVFIDQLPGFPDNIRATTKGTYFVAMAVSRIGGWHLLDLVAPYPSLRKFLLQIIPEKYSTVFLFGGPSNGLFIEVDANGNIIDSWQDPSGKIRYISQATDTGDAIYVGSLAHSFLAKIKR